MSRSCPAKWLSRGAALVAACAFSHTPVLSQSPRPRIWPGVEPGPYAVGYTVRHEHDYSRTFRRRLDYFGEPVPGGIARPVQIVVWYPAVADPRAGRMRVSEYYDAAATETDFRSRGPDELRALRGRRERLMLMEWRVPPERMEAARLRVDSVLAEPAAAVRDARPASGAFPLILHMPGYNGSPTELYPLAEYLASHGFVVAAVPNMGLHSREIDDERLSLDVQARDLEFAYSLMRTLPYVNADRVGTTGMSWGGMSNVLFASRNAYVGAVVTLDGAITMPVELGLIESVPGYSHGSLQAAYLQLLVSPEEATFRPKDLRFWSALRYSDAFSVQFNGVGHDDFSPGWPRLRNVVEADSARASYRETFVRALLEYTLRFLDGALRGNEAARASLSGLAAQLRLPDGTVARFDSRRALRVPPTADEFAAIVRSRGAAVAAAVYREVVQADSTVRLISSPVVGPIFMEAMEGRRFEEALAICELWAAALPSDVGPLFSKGRALRALGRTRQAIETYERILAVSPEGSPAAAARRALAELRGGR